MYLVTRIKTTVDPDENGDLKTTRTVDGCHVESSDQTAEQLIHRIKHGDHRVAGIRVFELAVSDEGTPTLGKELSPV